MNERERERKQIARTRKRGHKRCCQCLLHAYITRCSLSPVSSAHSRWLFPWPTSPPTCLRLCGAFCARRRDASEGEVKCQMRRVVSHARSVRSRTSSEPHKSPSTTLFTYESSESSPTYTFPPLCTLYSCPVYKLTYNMSL